MYVSVNSAGLCRGYVPGNTDNSSGDGTALLELERSVDIDTSFNSACSLNGYITYSGEVTAN